MGSLFGWPVVYEKDNSVLNNCDWSRYSESGINDVQYICGMRRSRETMNTHPKCFASVTDNGTAVVMDAHAHATGTVSIETNAIHLARCRCMVFFPLSTLNPRDKPRFFSSRSSSSYRRPLPSCHFADDLEAKMTSASCRWPVHHIEGPSECSR